MPNEDLNEYRKLHLRLIEELKPVGVLQEQTVEEIAICYWKKRNLIRYENATHEVEFSKLVARYHEARPRPKVKHLNDEVFLIVKRIQENVEATGQLSVYMKEELFRVWPDLEGIWPQLLQEVEKEIIRASTGADAKKLVAEMGFSVEDFEAGRVSPEQLCTASKKFLFTSVFKALQAFLESEGSHGHKLFLKLASAYTAIPTRKSLKACLRYGASVRKEFNGLLQQLERLQARHLELS